MTLHAVVTLFAAGLAGGVVTAIVGGASLITFPAMLAVGLPPIVANASNLVALTPANFMAALADRRRWPGWDRALIGLAAVSLAGGGAGAVLLLATPETVFVALVPLLIGFATVLFAAAGPIRRRLAARAARANHRPAPAALRAAFHAPVALYGGYFGAGVSVMLLAIFSITRAGDFRTVNVLKNLLSGLTGVVAIAIFIAAGTVAWPATLAAMAGGLAGGFLGARAVRLLPERFVRWFVIAAGAVLTVLYAMRYWG